jgi:very-short-patch-repair endonuclease
MKYFCPEEVRTRHGNLKYLDKLRPLARINRQQMTEAERAVWLNLLRNRQTGYLFLRQKPLGQFIADFYCSKLLLVIEIDGEIHNKQKYRDSERDLYFRQRNIETVRIKNDDILDNWQKVKEEILKVIEERRKEILC